MRGRGFIRAPGGGAGRRWGLGGAQPTRAACGLGGEAQQQLDVSSRRSVLLAWDE